MPRLRWLSHSSRGSRRYTRVAGDDSGSPSDIESADGYAEKQPAAAAGSPRWRIAGALVLTLTFLGLFVTSSKTFHDWVPTPFRPSYLFLVVTATRASPGLCKTLASSAVLGFPPPNVVGWDKDYDQVDGGAGVGKLVNTYSFLNKLDSAQDEALILFVDGGSSWFQLRPDVLISRYLDVNHAGNKRAHAQLGRAMVKEEMQQRIVFAAQTECPEGDVYVPRCWAVPPSPLPPTSSPPSTDANPRFLAGHAMIGPARDMRALLRRAKLKADRAAAKRVPVTLQQIFAEIFGEQEIARERARYRHCTWISTLVDRWQRRTSPIDTNYYQAEDERVSETNFEFGIGLDYAGQIFAPPATAAGAQSRPSAFLVHGNPDATELPPDAPRPALNVDLKRLSALSDPVVRASKPPFTTPAHARHPDLPAQNTSWAEVPLFTDLDTGVAPVLVPSHDGHDENLDVDADGWATSWMASKARLRHLLVARALSPIGVLGRIRLPGNAQPFDPLAPAQTTSKNAAGVGRSRAQRPLSAYEDSSLYYDSATRRPRPLSEQLRAYAATLPQAVVDGVRGGGERTHDWWPAGVQREGSHVWGGGDLQWDIICGDDRRVWGDWLGKWQPTAWWPEH